MIKLLPMVRIQSLAVGSLIIATAFSVPVQAQETASSSGRAKLPLLSTGLHTQRASTARTHDIHRNPELLERELCC